MKSNFMLLQAIKNLQEVIGKEAQKIIKNQIKIEDTKERIDKIDNIIKENTKKINTNEKEITLKINEIKKYIEEKIDNIKIRIPKDGKDGLDGKNRQRW